MPYITTLPKIWLRTILGTKSPMMTFYGTLTARQCMPSTHPAPSKATRHRTTTPIFHWTDSEGYAAVCKTSRNGMNGIIGINSLSSAVMCWRLSPWLSGYEHAKIG
jgi:hypothetical protein